jgi:uncharacterized RDD family membrane protein YckC
MVADEQVITGEAVVLELRPAGAGSRGIAALIDFAVIYAALLALVLLVAVVSSSANDATVAALLISVYVAVVLGYPVAMETLWRGKTLGKAAMGLRVARDDGGPIRFRHALVRGLAGVVIEKPGVTFGFVAFVLMVSTSRHKRLGDLMAGTIVLSERVPGTLDVPVQMPAPLAGWAAGLDLAGVDDALATRARQLLLRAGQLSPETLDRLQQGAARELVERVGPPPAGAPDWAVLAAVVAERRRRALSAAPSQPVTAAVPKPVSQPATQPPPAAPPTTAGGGFAPPA